MVYKEQRILRGIRFWPQIGDQKMNGVRLMTTWAKALTDALT